MGLFSNIFKSKDTRPKKYDTSAWYEYALRQEEKGNWQEAADCYMVIVERAKAKVDAYQHLFICLKNLKQWDKLEKYGRQFDDRLSYFHLDWGKKAISDAYDGRNADEDATNKGKDSKSGSTADVKQAETAVPQYGVVLKKKKVGNDEVTEVTWVDKPEPEPQSEEVEEEPKPKVIWPDKADFMPKPLPEGKITFGANFDRFCSKFPPYNFFDDEPEIPQKVIEQCHFFISLIGEARVTIEGEEAKNHYKDAAECCEVMTQGECWEPWPYTKLMEIYKGAGLLKEAEELRQYSIKFFTARRNRMEQQILKILEQQDDDTRDMVTDMIRDGKEIWYYRGLFKLYDPYPCIAEWQEMGDLSK